MAVELAADFNAIFLDCGLSANLHTAVFKDFNTVNNFNFLKHDALLV